MLELSPNCLHPLASLYTTYTKPQHQQQPDSSRTETHSLKAALSLPPP